jgi:hypothetical protein
VMSFSTLALAGEPGESVLPLVKEAKSVMTVIVRPEEVAGCGCAASARPHRRRRGRQGQGAPECG